MTNLVPSQKPREVARRTPPPGTPDLAAQMQPILEELESVGIQRRKQEDTIIAIIHEALLGKGFDRKQFWGRPDTASRTTYYKWLKHDERFPTVLEKARKAARKWASTSAIAHAEAARNKLLTESVAFVDTLISIATSGENEFARLQAAQTGLNFSFGAQEEAKAAQPPATQNNIVFYLPERSDLNNYNPSDVIDGSVEVVDNER